KSLVVMEAGDGVARYRLLETVRQFGIELLAAHGEREVWQNHHADYFLSMIETAPPNLVGGPNRSGLVDRLPAAYDTIRSAAMWSVSDAARAENGLRFAGALFWFWYAMGQFRENRQIVDRALALDAPVAPAIRGRALLSSGLTALAQGDYQLSRDHFERAL